VTDTIREFKTLAARQADDMRQRKQMAASIYAEILARLANPRDDDADTLAAAVAELGLTPEQVDADAQAARMLQAARSSVVDDAEIQRLTEKYVKADSAMDRLREKYERELVKIRDERDAILRARDRAGDGNRKAKETEGNLRRTHPRLFGTLAAPVLPADPKPSLVFKSPSADPTPEVHASAGRGSDFNGRTTWAARA
jgi:hypothetical protein